MAKDPDGFALACTHCRFVFPDDITTGVAVAHFEAEHETSEVRFELVVLCPRCEKPMQLSRTEAVRDGQRLHYTCAPCGRSRVVKQGATA